MEASDVYLKNGRRYLRIGTPPVEYLKSIPLGYGPEWEQAYQEMVDDGVLINGKPMCSLEEEKYNRYIAWRNSERTATTGYVCSMCHEICEGKLGFCKTKKNHKCYHDGIEEEKKEEYGCEVCEKLFKNKHNLQKHKESKTHLRKVQAQTDLNRNFCRLCDKNFSSTACLRKHEATCELHKKMVSGKFCKHCDKMFSSRDCFKRHHKKHHPVVF